MGLADLIHRQAKQREASEVDAIVGGNGTAHGAVLEKLTAPARKATADAELSAMRAELEEHPEHADTGAGTGYLFGKYKNIPDAQMWKVIEGVKAARHPRTGGDTPEAEPGEFVRFRR
ncbi:MAG: hypothetical protein DMG44_17785 [Acidobacteria bacterium]|nr:MAG: hypothetical protein DMG44_17785 [Acidobacteriota bacterium]